ncbi:MAG: GDSL-type esterase/lipase family protein [Acidobacteriota bacterium]
MKISKGELLGRLLLIAVSLGTTLIFSEVVVRILRPQPMEEITPGLYEGDPPRRYRLRPGYSGRVSNGVEFDTRLEINALGLRGPVPGEEARRLMVIGDSFVFGWGVEHSETVSQLAAERLGLEGVNGGIPGYGLPDTVDWLEAYGEALEPDVLVLGVFVGNDLLDATPKHREVTVEEGLVTAESRPSLARRLLHQTHLTRLAKSAIPWSLQSRLRGLLGLPEPWRVTYLRDALQSYAVEPTELVSEGREATRRAFDRLLGISRERGLGLAVMLIPDVLQLSPERWAATLESIDVDPASVDPEVPNRFFRELAEGAGVPVIDLLPVFRRAGAESGAREPLYFMHDPHWTAAGHGLAAEHLADALRSAGLDTASAGAGAPEPGESGAAASDSGLPSAEPTVD